MHDSPHTEWCSFSFFRLLLMFTVVTGHTVSRRVDFNVWTSFRHVSVMFGIEKPFFSINMRKNMDKKDKRIRILINLMYCVSKYRSMYAVFNGVHCTHIFYVICIGIHIHCQAIFIQYHRILIWLRLINRFNGQKYTSEKTTTHKHQQQ